MTTKPSYLGTSPDGEPTFTIDQHEGIPRPQFIPEVKWDEGFIAILDHVNALDRKNPILVPSAAYPALREKRNIVTRTNDDGDQIGEEEVASLESDHPLLYYDPPELYNFRRSSALKVYYFKGNKEDKKNFEDLLQEGRYEDALDLLPQFQQEFIKANFERVTEEIDGASPPRSAKYEPDSTLDAWDSLDGGDMEGYFSEITADASNRSAAVIPPVPVIDRNLRRPHIPATCTANRTMAQIAGSQTNSESYFHLCISGTTLRPSGNDPGTAILDILRKELERGTYAGIALTIRNPHKIDAAGSLARLRTFISDIGRIGEEFGLPVIAPRSEWLGTLVTDNGLSAYSAMMNSGWEYTQNRSGGPGDEWKKYGKLTTFGDNRKLLANPEEPDNLVEYLESGDLNEIDNLPSEPPGNPEGETLKQILGTPRKFRTQFSKPRKLGHIVEAQMIREAREDGAKTPARDQFEESSSPYFSIE